MAFGYTGRILRVNLSDEKIQVETPDENFYRKYVGGSALVGYYLLRETEPNIDPLGSENKLIFATGVMSGAPFSGGGRNSVGAKSPLTGGFGDAQVGGYWGTEFKQAGFDAAVIEGKAKSPVYIWVRDGEAEIRDAKDLWGKDVGESQDLIRKELQDRTIRTAQIGLAGEHMVRYACIICDLRASAGRTGLGAVMGSKNLKAVAAKGRDRVKVANADKLRELARWFSENMPKVIPGLHNYGTGAEMDAGAASGNLPYHNFRDGKFPNVDAISAKTVKDTVSAGMETCYACSVRCKKVVKIEGSVDPKYGGPEYETLASFGSNCGIEDLASVCKANEICSRYGLDTISTGVTIAFAMECFEKGILAEKDTGGIKLNFGNAEAMLQTLELIARREGIGSLLAEGTKKAAEKLGPEAQKLAVHVKGLEVPMHEPRLKRALGLGYATSPTGADHQHNMHDTGFSEKAWRDIKSLGVLEPVAVEDFGPAKVRLFKYFSTWRHLMNCMVLCTFTGQVWSYEQQVELVNAVSGWNTTAFELFQVGERALNMARAFNFREGFTVKDDWLPDRFFKPQNVGPLSKAGVDPDQLLRARHLYYKMMSWNEATGAPTPEKLEELNIGWVSEKVHGP